MRLLLWTLLLILIIEIAAGPSKRPTKDRKQPKNNESTRRKGKQPTKSPLLKGKIGRLWEKIKEPFKALKRKVFWTLARFFDGKRSYIWSLFGKRIRIVVPRMPRSRKEAKRRLAAIRKAIRRNPMGRCLAALYVNLAVFIIGYAVLFIYNIHCYFRYRRARAAARDNKSLFDPEHLFAGSKLPKNLSSAIKKAATVAARKAREEELTSPTKTVLEEDEEEVMRELDEEVEVNENVITKPSPTDDSSKRIELVSETGSPEYMNPVATGAITDEGQESDTTGQTPRVGRKVTFKDEVPRIPVKRQIDENEDFKERSFAAAEVFDDSDERASVASSQTSSLRHRIHRAKDQQESKSLLSDAATDNGNAGVREQYKTPLAEFRFDDNNSVTRFSIRSSSSSPKGVEYLPEPGSSHSITTPSRTPTSIIHSLSYGQGEQNIARLNEAAAAGDEMVAIDVEEPSKVNQESDPPLR